MRMSHTYGIFDDEADPIIDLVRSHAPLEEIQRAGCPACGSAIRVTFSDDGQCFSIGCSGKPLHMSRGVDIGSPPSWWRECVPEQQDQSWVWRDWYSFDDDGTLSVQASGWQADGTRWSGALVLPRDHADHAFWKWVVLESGCDSDLIDDAEVEQLKARFAERD